MQVCPWACNHDAEQLCYKHSEYIFVLLYFHSKEILLQYWFNGVHFYGATSLRVSCHLPQCLLSVISKTAK
jgi:hypothetical protein